MAELATTAAVQAHPYGGAPAPVGIYPGAIIHDQDTGNVVLRSQAGGPGDSPLDIPLAGPAAGGVPVVYTFVGAGPVVIPDDATRVYLNPAGGAQVVTLPAANSRTTQLALELVLIGTGTAEILPGAPDRLYVGSSSYVMRGVPSALVLVPNNGTAWRKVAQVGSPVDFSCFVDAAGSDENPGTLALPVQSVQEALRRADTTKGQDSVAIEVGAGAFVLDALFNPPAGALNGSPLRIRGTLFNTGTQTVTGFTPGTVRSPAVIIAGGAGFPVNGLRNGVAVFTSGMLSGQRFGIADNTATDVRTLVNDPLVGLNIGDTFDVYVQNTSLSAPVLQMLPGSGSAVFLERMFFDPGLLVVYGVTVGVSEVAIRSLGIFFDVNAALISLAGGFSATITRDALGPGGMAFTPRGGILVNTALRNVSVQAFLGTAFTLRDVQMLDASSRAATENGGILEIAGLSALDGYTLSPGTHFLHARGGTMRVTNTQILGVTGGQALRVEAGANAPIESVQGTGNDSPCVRSLTGGIITVTDAGAPGGTTIDGGLTPAQVGNNAPVAWGAIGAGAPADTTDTAQLARIGA